MLTVAFNTFDCSASCIPYKSRSKKADEYYYAYGKNADREQLVDTPSQHQLDVATAIMGGGYVHFNDPVMPTSPRAYDQLDHASILLLNDTNPPNGKKEKSKSSKKEKSKSGTIGKSQGETIGKSQGGTIGKSQGETIGKSQGGTIGKSQGGTIGKSQGGTIGKSQGETIGKSQGGTIGKSQGGTIGKYQGETIGKYQGETMNTSDEDQIAKSYYPRETARSESLISQTSQISHVTTSSDLDGIRQSIIPPRLQSIIPSQFQSIKSSKSKSKESSKTKGKESSKRQSIDSSRSQSIDSQSFESSQSATLRDHPANATYSTPLKKMDKNQVPLKYQNLKTKDIKHVDKKNPRNPFGYFLFP